MVCQGCNLDFDIRSLSISLDIAFLEDITSLQSWALGSCCDEINV